MTNKVKELVVKLAEKINLCEINEGLDIKVCQDFLQDCKAELERLEAENTWQPIETAPAGEDILLAGGTYQNICSGSNKWYKVKKGNVYMGKKFGKDDYFSVDDYFYIKPKIWRKIPQPPEGV